MLHSIILMHTYNFGIQIQILSVWHYLRGDRENQLRHTCHFTVPHNGTIIIEPAHHHQWRISPDLHERMITVTSFKQKSVESNTFTTVVSFELVCDQQCWPSSIAFDEGKDRDDYGSATETTRMSHKLDLSSGPVTRFEKAASPCFLSNLVFKTPTRLVTHVVMTTTAFSMLATSDYV